MLSLWMRIFELFVIIKLVNTADPVEQFFRSIALTAKQLGEKWISQVPIPTMNDIGPYPGSLMYKMDPKTVDAIGSLTEFFNSCPAPQYTDITGSWAIIFSSQQLLQTLFQDIDEVVDRLMMKQLLNTRKTLGSLFREESRMQCATIQVSNDGSFELSYLAENGPKSIIGRATVNGDQTITWEFAPTVHAEFTVIYTSQVAEATKRDVVILAQTDSFPKCENVIVLARTRMLYQTIYGQLNQGGHNTAANPLLSIECQMIENGTPFDPNPPQNLIVPMGIGGNPMINQPGPINSIIRPIP